MEGVGLRVKNGGLCVFGYCPFDTGGAIVNGADMDTFGWWFSILDNIICNYFLLKMYKVV